MPSPLAAAAIQGGTTLGQGLLQGIQDRRNIKKQLQANKELAKYQYSLDSEMWQRANDYNSPSAQMARFQEAGLNPNLIYSQGNPGNTATTLPKYQAPQVDYSNVSPLVQLPQLIGIYQDFKLKQAQTDNVIANTKATEAKTLTEVIRKSLVDAQLISEQKRPAYIEAQTGSEVTRQSNAQLQGQINRSKWQADQTYWGLRNQAVELDNVKRSQDIIFKQYINEFKKMGINDSDHPVIRILGRIFGENIAPRDIGRSIIKNITDLFK